MTEKFKGYAIVKKGTARLLSIQATLPIYWLKKIATKRAKEFYGSEVISTDELLKRINNPGE